MDLFDIVIAGACGGFSVLLTQAVAAWADRRKADQLGPPVNCFRGTLFPDPADPEWRVDEVLECGPVRVTKCQIVCDGVLFDEGERVGAYYRAICTAHALAALERFEAGRTRELLS
jgi:hypothetical protein